MRLIGLTIAVASLSACPLPERSPDPETATVPPVALATEQVRPPSGTDVPCTRIADAIAQVVGSRPELDSSASFESPVDGSPLHGCVIRAAGTSDPSSHTPDARLVQALTEAGWRQDPSFSADGPDETAGTLTRGTDTCYFFLLYEPAGTESPEGEAQPAPYRLTLRCTSAG